jgi:hypothetical protein
MAGPGQARFYSSTFVQTAITGGGIGPSSTSFNVGVTTGAPGTPFVISVDQNTASEELMLVTNVSGNTYTVTRAVGGTSATTHNVNAPVVHVMYAQDLTDASAHIGAYDGVHGVAPGSLVVGTNDTQTLFNKTLQTPILNNATLNTTTLSGTTTAGVINSNGAITGTDFVASGLTGTTAASRYVGATSTGLAPTSGTFAVGDYIVDNLNGKIAVCTVAGSPGTWIFTVNTVSSQTLTNKTLTSPVINGSVTGNASVTLSNFIVANEFIANGITGATAASTYAGGTASGAPTTGAHTLGEFVIDQTGRIWVCTSAGTPGTWVPTGGAQGTVAAPISTASAGTPTSAATETFDAVLGNLTVSLVAGRRYRASMNGLIGNPGATSDVYMLQIRDSGSASAPTSASTLIAQSEFIAFGAGSSGRASIPLANTFVSGSTGTHTLGMSATKTSGTGPFTAVGTRELLVEDLGVF